MPWYPLYWAVGYIRSAEFESPADRVENIVTSGLVAGSLIGTVAFEGYAYYRLFQIYSLSTVLLWVNLLVSIAMLAFAIIHFASSSDPDDRSARADNSSERTE
jgi:hypothetical protein